MTQPAGLPPRTLYLDDLHVGQRFVSRPYLIETEEITTFAAAYDPQPFHTDPVAARDSVFEGLAASGWHTAAITMRLIVECMPVAGGIIGWGGEIAWPRATRPGDRLTVEVEVLEVVQSRSKPDRGSARLRITTRNQAGEAVQTLTPKVLVLRRNHQAERGP